ncbi:MAG: YebC/PmpR family DNA-binding transcriptional regulator, partial [Actinomycetota bacterium]
DEVTYEGYGPGGVAVFVQCLTNNRNRSAQDVRAAFNAHDGKMADAGSVSWMFEPKGIVLVTKDGTSEDEVFLVAADAGAEDVRVSDESIEVVTPPDRLKEVEAALQEAGVTVESTDLTQVPKTTVPLSESEARQVLHLIDALEELDDVAGVYANFDIPDEVLASLAS